MQFRMQAWDFQELSGTLYQSLVLKGRIHLLCIKGSENLSEEQLKKLGANDSLIHVDFMIGTADLEVTGYTNDGTKISVFKNGNWAF